MKVLKFEKEKVAKLKIETLTDLWHLSRILEPEDFVKSKTLRNIFIERNGQKIKVGRKPMTLKISVEHVEYSKDGKTLRVHGKIVEGPEDVKLGSYHTIEISPGSVVEVEKPNGWKISHLQRLKLAQQKQDSYLIVAVDYSTATFAKVDPAGVKILEEINNPHPISEDKNEEFYKHVAKRFLELVDYFEKAMIVGPGFAKDHVMKIINSLNPSIAKKVFVGFVSSVHLPGVNEALKRYSEILLKKSRTAEEVQLLDEFFKQLSKGGLVAYGLKEVKKAVDLGAVKTLIISEDLMKDDAIEELARKVEEMGGNVEIISATHEEGEKFRRIGGVGAFLRFDTSDV